VLAVLLLTCSDIDSSIPSTRISMFVVQYSF
jgi:hypothetical protein